MYGFKICTIIYTYTLTRKTQNWARGHPTLFFEVLEHTLLLEQQTNKTKNGIYQIKNKKKSTELYQTDDCVSKQDVGESSLKWNISNL